MSPVPPRSCPRFRKPCVRASTWERYYGTGDIEFPQAYGDAIRSAEWLADAIHEGLSGARRLNDSLAEHRTTNTSALFTISPADWPRGAASTRDTSALCSSH